MSRNHRRIPRKAWERVRLSVLDRDNYRCRVCGAPGFEVDHITPMESGGAALDMGNLQTICRSDHIDKTRGENERDPELTRWRRWLSAKVET